MAKHEEIGFRDEILWLLDAEPYITFTITMTSGDKYHIGSREELSVGESVANFHASDGSQAFFRLQQISNVDIRPAAKDLKK